MAKVTIQVLVDQSLNHVFSQGAMIEVTQKLINQAKGGDAEAQASLLMFITQTFVTAVEYQVKFSPGFTLATLSLVVKPEEKNK